MTNKFTLWIKSTCSKFAKIPFDKLLHFILAYIIFDASIALFAKLSLPFVINYASSFAITLLALVGKEVVDEINYKGFDIEDILAGFFAIVLKTLIIIFLVV